MMQRKALLAESGKWNPCYPNSTNPNKATGSDKQDSLLAMVTRMAPTRGRRPDSGDESSSVATTPRMRRARSGSGDGGMPGLAWPESTFTLAESYDSSSSPYGAKYGSRQGVGNYQNILKFVTVALFFIGIAMFVVSSTSQTASKVRGKNRYCPKDYPEPFSKCTFPPGTECPFQCINMPIYNRNDKCTGEVLCTPEKHCTCEESRGGEWFCFGGRTHMDDECKQRNYETYEPCDCPRTLVAMDKKQGGHPS